jgi:putative ABC transport system permease protein
MGRPAIRTLAVRTLAAHRARLALTLAAVALGTAFVAGTLSFTAATERAEQAAPLRTDVAVQVTAGDGRLPRAAADRLARLPGVASAHPLVSGPGALLDRDGVAVEDPSGVTSWAATGRLALTAGRAPAGPAEVALSEPAARAAGLRVGETASLRAGGAGHRSTVVGIYRYRALGDENPPAMAFEEATAQRLLGLPGQVTAVDLVADPGVPAADLAARARAAVPGATAVDGQAANAAARDRRAAEARTLGNALLGFAGIALLVGTFVIANTFAMLVGQRTRELGLLRAVALSRRQVRRMVLAEAALVGLAGGLAGTAAGHGFAVLAVRLLDDRTGTAPVVVDWPALAAGLAVAVGVTVLSAWASARRASRTSPVDALRGEAASPPGAIRRRTLAGLLVAAPGAAVYGYAAVTDQIDEQVGLVGLGGAALLLLAVVLLAPALCRLLLGPLSAPLARLGAAGRLAAGNARRNPRRTAATASALMVSLSVVTGLAIFGHSLERHTVAGVRRDVAAELVAQPADRGQAAIPQRTVEELAAVPGVRAVAALRYASLPVRVGPLDARASVTVTDPAALGPALRLAMVSGRVGDLAGGVFVSDDLARRYGLSPGDRLGLGWPRGGGREYPVTGVYQASSLVSGVLVPQSEALPRLEEADAFTAFVALAPGADEAAVRAGLERAVADRPDLVVRSRAAYLERELGDADRILGVLYALLALAVVIGVLGVANTLTLSVVERTREIGLLRALGLTRRQLRTMVRAESALIALAGGVLGIAGGWLLGAMFQRAALRTGLLEAAVPAGQLLVALAGLGLAGLAAAAWPARRAARTDILAAIATG